MFDAPLTIQLSYVHPRIVLNEQRHEIFNNLTF